MKISNLSDDNFNSGEYEEDQFTMDVLMGFCSKPKELPAKYFYDDIGSELFQKITQHEDYYPTRTEFKILESLKDKLPKLSNDKNIDIIELGAGDGHKSNLIIQGYLNQGFKVTFYPIDISEKAMYLLEENITANDNLTIHGVVAEYFEGLRFVRRQSTNPQLVLFLGSNVGNFNRVQIQGFLRRLWKVMDDGDQALIGFDLKKNIDKLINAYNDSAGHTRDFNINILRRINQKLGANFDLEKFDHFGTYNPLLGAMESFLVSTEEQEVYIKELERSFRFKAYEPIHLEYSFKFLKSDIDFLSENTGFEVIEHFTDENNYFVDSLWKVKKEAVRN